MSDIYKEIVAKVGESMEFTPSESSDGAITLKLIGAELEGSNIFLTYKSETPVSQYLLDIHKAIGQFSRDGFVYRAGTLSPGDDESKIVARYVSKDFVPSEEQSQEDGVPSAKLVTEEHYQAMLKSPNDVSSE